MTDKEKLEKLKKLADARYYAAQYLTTDASMLHKAMDEYHKFIIHECKEEPVSEELWEAAQIYYEELQKEKFEGSDVIDAFKAGAKWQKTKDESTTEDLGDYINELSKQFPEVSFAKLSRIAVRVAKWQRQQMMAKAIDGKVIANGMGNPILHLWDKGRHFIGKKVKVIVIEG